jgi:TM2 domain-containing membrane protein YozV
VSETKDAVPGFNPQLAAVAAWLFPGAGHFLLGRRARALAYLAILAAFVAVGLWLEGNLYRVVSGQPLTFLATLGAMGLGVPYFVLRYGFHYTGEITAATYEYGSAFLLTAGVLNLLLVLDAWDIAHGRKE